MNFFSFSVPSKNGSLFFIKVLFVISIANALKELARIAKNQVNAKFHHFAIDSRKCSVMRLDFFYYFIYNVFTLFILQVFYALGPIIAIAGSAFNIFAIKRSTDSIETASIAANTSSTERCLP